MFKIEFNTKTMIVAGAIALAAATVTTAVVMWKNKKEWSIEAADKSTEEVLKAFNDAITKFPDDRAKASFMYEASANVIRETFKAQYSQFEEYAAWETKFDATVKAQKAAMRKP